MDFTPRYDFNLSEELEPITTSEISSFNAESRKHSSSSTSIFKHPLLPGQFKRKKSNRAFSFHRYSSIKSNFSSKSNASSYSSSSLGKSSRLFTPRLQQFKNYDQGMRSKTPYASSTPRRCSSTPRRTTTSSVPGSTPRLTTQSIIVAIIEGRGVAKGEIGVASFDLRRPILNLFQFDDGQTYTKLLSTINTLDPLEIVLPNTIMEEGAASKLYTQLTQFCSRTKILPVNRKYFNDETGFQYIKSLGVPESKSIQAQLQGKYYALSATSALFKYVEYIQNYVIAPRTLIISLKASEKSTMIDWSTAMNLELLKTNTDQKTNYSLFGILNKCRTLMGARQLRTNILQPSTDLETIQGRLDAVQELWAEVETYHLINGILGRFVDLHTLLSSIVQVPKIENKRTAENKLTTVICLKSVLEIISQLKEAMADLKAPMLVECRKAFDSPLFEIILKDILIVIKDEAFHAKGNKVQKIFAIKEEHNDLLRVWHLAFNELMADMTTYASSLSTETGKVIRISQNATRGYFFLHTMSSHMKCQEDMPEKFINITRNKNVLSFTTENMIKYNDRLNCIMDEIYQASTRILNDLLDKIRNNVACLHQLSESVASIDIICSFVKNCMTANTKYIKPEFNLYMKLSEAHHPILNQMISNDVPNTVLCSNECNFVILSGENMSGKSTYLRKVALLQIMAQIGSYVPAEEATFKICDQIFTRFRNDNRIVTNDSTFMAEMKDVNYIISNSKNKSLIIIDELGRDTDSIEGSAICFAICEHLLTTGAFIFFSTHYKLVMELENYYDNAINYHMQNDYSVEESISATSNNMHKLKKGKLSEQLYGLKLFEKASAPSTLVNLAKTKAKIIQDKCMAGASYMMGEEKNTDGLIDQLLSISINSSQMSDLELKEALKQLKESYK